MDEKKMIQRVFKCKLVEKKADDEKGIIEAYVSISGNEDSYGDIIQKGAFLDSLKRKLPVGVWSHNWDQPIAKTLEAKEDSHGLYIKGKLVMGVQKAKEAYELMREGVIDEFSIGFFIEEYEWDEINEIRTIKKIKLVEWSPVVAGANPDTSLISVKSKENKKEDDEGKNEAKNDDLSDKKEEVAVDTKKEVKEPEKAVKHVKTMKELVIKDNEVRIKYKNNTLSEKFIISKELKDLLQEKAGKVLSSKNRGLVESVITGIEELNDNTKQILAPLKSLLEATDEKSKKVEAPKSADRKNMLILKANSKKVDKINEVSLKILKNIK